MARGRLKLGIALILLIVSVKCSAAFNLPFDAKQNPGWKLTATEAILLDSHNGAPSSLILSKDQFKQSKISLTIECDATEFDVHSGDHAVSFVVPKKAPIHVEIDQTGDRPVLLIEGRERADSIGKWIEVMEDHDANLQLIFAAATFANVKFDIGGGNSGNITGDGNGLQLSSVPVSSSGNTSGNTGNAPPLQKSVLQLTVKDSNGEAYASGTTFIVSADGFAVTNFHVVQGASSAVASLPDSKGEIPVELWAAEPNFDLALIKLNSVSAHYTALPIAAAPPRIGEEVWAFGFPKFGFTVTHGTVTGLRTFATMDKDVRSIFKDYSPDSKWIQTDCTINHGNSGGPLVDDNGAVVGVNTWFWDFDAMKNVFFSLSSTHLNPLLSTERQPAITFAGAIKQYGSVKAPGSEVPPNIPHIDIPEQTTAQDVIAAARALQHTALKPCTHCRGTGTVTVSVQVGTGSFNVPIFQNQQQQCSVCGGTGMIRGTPEALEHVAENLAKSISSLKKSEQEQRDRLKLAYLAVQDFLKDPSAALEITEQTRPLFTQHNSLDGLPITSHAIYLGNFPSDDGQRIHVAIIGDGQLVLLTNPIAYDEMIMNHAFIGGICAGKTKGRDGTDIVVLQNGFIFNMADQDMTPRGQNRGVIDR